MLPDGHHPKALRHKTVGTHVTDDYNELFRPHEMTRQRGVDDQSGNSRGETALAAPRCRGLQGGYPSVEITLSQNTSPTEYDWANG